MGIEEQRTARRFEINCQVSVRIQGRGHGQSSTTGHLCNIAVGGARLYIEHPPEPGTRVVLHVHFFSPGDTATTVRFEGTVVRLDEEPAPQAAVQFRRGGRFLQDAGLLGQLSYEYRS